MSLKRKIKNILAIIFLILAPLVILAGIASSVACFVTGNIVSGICYTFSTLLWSAVMAWSLYARIDP